MAKEKPKPEPTTDYFPEWCYRNADPLPLLRLSGHEINRAHEWKTKREEILGRVLPVLGSPSTGSVPLEPEILEERSSKQFVRRKVRYQVQPGDAVTAYLMIPRGSHGPSKRYPAVLCLHQTIAAGKREPAGLAGKSTLHYALHLTNLGFVTLAPDSVTAGERVPKRPGLRDFDTTEFYEQHPEWSAVGKMIWDNRSAVDYLCGLDFVDPARIGCIGHSHGGFGAFSSMAFDTRLAAGACSCGFSPFAGDDRVLGWARRSWYIYMKKLRPLFLRQQLPFDLHEMQALVAPRPLLILSGVGDPIFPHVESIRKSCEELKKVYALLGVPDHLEFRIHHDGHAFRAPVRELTYNWLRRYLI